MGWCKPKGSDVYESGWGEQECITAGGTYSNTDPSASSTGGCFITTIMTRSLGQAILDLGKTYQTQVDFRDSVLNNTPIGKRMVRLYYQINPVVLRVVMGNPELLGRSIRAWSNIVAFVSATVASSAHDGAAGPNAGRRLRFTRQQHRRIVQVFADLRAQSRNRRLHRALGEVEAELRKYVGLTPPEALRMLRRESSSSRRRHARR